MAQNKISKKFIFLIILATLGLLIIVTTGFYFLSKQPQTNNLLNKIANNDSTSSQSSSKTKKTDFELSTWSPDWASNSAVESLNTSGNNLTNISPVWFDLEKTGKLINKTPSNSTKIIETAKKYNLEITPSIACFDHEILTGVFASTQNFDRHIEEILAITKNPDFSGIDIDYESTKLSDKGKYFEFLEKLSSGLKILNKKLIVSVLPKWGDDIVYKGLKETRQVQDYAEIAKYADEIRLMTYDFGGSKTSSPTPVAPISWQESVVKYAVSKVDSKKISLGQPLYAYEKYVEVLDSVKDKKFNDPQLIFQSDLEKISYSEVSLRAYTYTTIKEILAKYPGTLEESDGEKIYKYSKVNDTTGILENRVVVFQDQNNQQARIDLAKKYNLKGVSFWRLGGESDLISGLKIGG